MSEYIVGNDGDESILDIGEFELRFQERERIVRCRDCVNFVADELGEVCGLFEFEIVDGSMADGFCKWGERK